MRRERSMGRKMTPAAIAPFLINFILSFKIDFPNDNKVKFTARIHSVPPAAPVMEYHWMYVLIEKYTSISVGKEHHLTKIINKRTVIC
jgi:hypothetical protein